MNLILFGSSAFAVPVFEHLRLNHNILALYTRKPKPAGRRQVKTPTPTDTWADSFFIPVHYNLDTFDNKGLDIQGGTCKILTADFCVVMSYGVIIPPEVLAKGRFINVHPSDLPKYRGPSPIQTMLANGDTSGAVCLTKMVNEVDAGPIYLKETFPVFPTDTKATIEEMVSDISMALLDQYLANCTLYSPKPQVGKPTFTKKITAECKEVDWANDDPMHIHNVVRAYGGAYTTLYGKRVKILETSIDGGVLSIVKVQPCGGKAMDGKAFFNGCRVGEWVRSL